MTNVNLRPARQDDAAIGSKLLYLSGPALFSHVFNRPPDAAELLLAKMWTRGGHLFSYQWAKLAEIDSQAVGILTGFTSEELRQASSRMPLVLARLLWPWDLARLISRSSDAAGLSPDIKENDYYIGHVAVLPAAQSQGVGHVIMNTAEAQARNRECRRCALDVVIENDRAQALYRHCGYTILETHTNRWLEKRCGISGMHRMVKSLKDG